MEALKKLFFSETLKRWHFEEIVKSSGLSRERVNYFIKLLVRTKFILRVKPRNKMPFYIANREYARFREEKRLYGLEILKETGLLEHVNSLPRIKTVIIFGSFARGDWNKSSDVDIFMFGNADDFNKGLFESKLKREIQLFNFEKAKNVKKELDEKLVANIVKGFNIKQNLEPFEVRINA